LVSQEETDGRLQLLLGNRTGGGHEGLALSHRFTRIRCCWPWLICIPIPG